jgi:hypothetical protein
MPNPIAGTPDGVPRPPALPGQVPKDEDVALELPAWDLLPPAEFLERHRRG